jgi:hypothetical protein
VRRDKIAPLEVLTMDGSRDTSFEEARELWAYAPPSVQLPALGQAYLATAMVRAIEDVHILNDVTNGDGSATIEFVFEDFSYSAWFEPRRYLIVVSLEYCVSPAYSDSEMVARCARANARNLSTNARWIPKTHSLTVVANILLGDGPGVAQLFIPYLRELRTAFNSVLA